MTEHEVHKHLDALITILDYRNGPVFMSVFREGHAAVITAGKGRMTSTVPKLYQLIKHQSEYVRDQAVASLGFPTRLGWPAFKDTAKEIFDTDPNQSVKGTALAAWASYYDLTKDKFVLAELYKALINRSYGYYIRSTAYEGLFDVTEGPTLKYEPYSMKMIDAETDEEFASYILWDEVERIMRTYAPDEFEQINNPSSLRLK